MDTSIARRAALASGAVAAFAALTLAACTASPPHRAAAEAARWHLADAEAACPAGRLLPQGGQVMIDWIDFLQFDGRQYIAGLGPAAKARTTELGRVVTRIRCSMAAMDDHRHIDIPLVDRSAAFIPVGAAVYAIHGYSPRCRLAAYVSGQLHVYLAQHAVNGHTAPVRCAVSPAPA